MKALAGGALVLLVAVATACGGSGETTTVVDEGASLEALQLEKERAELEAETAQFEAEKSRQESKQAVVDEESQPEPESDSAPESESEAEPEEASAPPNVIGLPLPAAERQLSAAGYATAAVNTDTLFGIVNEDNYTICRQSPPRGDVVKVLAQKYGCS